MMQEVSDVEIVVWIWFGSWSSSFAIGPLLAIGPLPHFVPERGRPTGSASGGHAPMTYAPQTQVSEKWKQKEQEIPFGTYPEYTYYP